MNTELNFPRRLLAGLTALALLLMLALPVWAEGEETEKLPVSINSVEDLLQLVTDCRLDSWSEDRTVDLNTDLDLTGVDFAGIPTFSGTFDGNGHTISGLSLVDDGSVTGFFRYIQADGVVHDLAIRGRSMPSGSRTTVGGIVGSNAGTLINCRFEGVASGASIVGGIAGTNLSSGTINNCTTTGSVYGAHFIGGIVGENHGTIESCTFNGSVSGKRSVGGVLLLLLQLLPHVVLICIERVEFADVLGKFIVQRRQFAHADGVHLDMENGVLPGQILLVIFLGELDVDVELFASGMANNLILETGDEGAGAQNQRVMLCLAALKSLAINKALKVDINGITVLSSALTGQQTAVAVLHALHFGVNICLVDILGFFGHS